MPPETSQMKRVDPEGTEISMLMWCAFGDLGFGDDLT